MDFAGAPEESRARINDWVAEETGDKVRNLLQPGSIDPSTRLVLTNAIYFNASWHWPFDRRQTKVHPFHLEGGGSVDVPMMTETSKDFYGYAKGDGYQAVDVPYSWGEMSMTALKTSGWPLPQSLLQGIDAEVGLQGFGQSPGHHVPAVPVHDGHQVEESPGMGK